MLSSQEHQRLINQLEHIPRSFTAKQKQTFQREIKKKLKEHEYASQFLPFESSFFDIIFINRTTSTDTLNRLISLVKDSLWFTLDTESTNVSHQQNIPSLIQLQIIQSKDISTILIFEFSHLPPSNQHQFQLIQSLFDALLQSTKIIFTWGALDELEKFTRFGLITSDQLDLPQQLNVQRRFRTYWSDTYPHRLSSSNDTERCLCLDCFGITHDNLISLQDAIAIALNRWIDKRLTRHPFDIGLDPQLQHLNQRQMEYRQSMTRYAANDCDAVKQIIIQTNIIREIKLSITLVPDTLMIDQFPSPNSPYNEIPPEAPPIEPKSSQGDTHESTMEWILEPILEEDDDLIISSTSTTDRMVTITKPLKHQQTTNLSTADRKKIHNRSCTLRQRRRLYEYKITCPEIDSRFAIRTIKQMLDDHHINFTAVNTVKSRSNSKAVLYIGVDDSTAIQTYGTRVRALFTTENYNRIYHRNYNYQSDNRYHQSK